MRGSENPLWIDEHAAAILFVPASQNSDLFNKNIYKNINVLLNNNIVIKATCDKIYKLGIIYKTSLSVFPQYLSCQGVSMMTCEKWVNKE